MKLTTVVLLVLRSLKIKAYLRRSLLPKNCEQVKECPDGYIQAYLDVALKWKSSLAYHRWKTHRKVEGRHYTCKCSKRKNNNCKYPNTSKRFVWKYPRIPENIDFYKEHGNAVLFSGYPSVCREISPNQPFINLNLCELTKGTIYESFISYHFYCKVFHGKEYIHHVQSVAICSFLLDCNYNIENASLSRDQFLKYDPTKAGVAPLILETLADNYNERPCAILGYDSRVPNAKDANSGDEFQALTALQFLPEHKITVHQDSRFNDIADGTSPFLIANAWYGAYFKFPPPMPTEDKNNNILFTPAHLSGAGKKLITKHKDYWKDYVSHSGPVGTRDTPTLDFLIEQGI